MTKKKDPKDYLKVGRPTIMTDAVVAKLEQGFKIGLNDTECCAYAGISRDALYDYIKKYPEFGDKKEEWKLNPIAKAKYTVFQNLDDVRTAQWYLEKKCGNEFAGNQINNIVNVNNQNLQINENDIKNVISDITELAN